MIQLDEKQLHQLQRVELELLLEADRICRKCGIHYNIIAGTLLGAVRHGGFIPWDDDADIALLRGEYEKFRRACETELDTSRFYFQDHENTPGYRWGYGKLRRKGTTFLREHQEHMPYEQGVFIDVFPLDSVPAAPIARQVHSARCYLIRKFLWSEVGKTAAKNPWKRLLFRVMSCVPRETIFRRYAKLVEAGCHHSSRWVRILTFPTPTKDEGYLRAWYEHSAPTVFEGQTFSGIADVDSYLSFKFGNYHELPPESQRKVHPVTKLQLVEPQMTKTNVLRGGDRPCIIEYRYPQRTSSCKRMSAVFLCDFEVQGVLAWSRCLPSTYGMWDPEKPSSRRQLINIARSFFRRLPVCSL